LKRRTEIKGDPRKPILIAGFLSITVYLITTFLFPAETFRITDEGMKATRAMGEAVRTIQHYCEQHTIPIDGTADPNRTGLIGPQNSEITSTLGHAETKRTTTNPYMAGLLVHLLRKAGVKKGDTVVISSSGSFPALLIASMCAAEALSVRPVAMISLGASSYGASLPDFNLLHIYDLLYREGIFPVRPAVISLGGDQDVGNGFTDKTNEKLRRQISDSGIPFVYESDLVKNISSRMSILQEKIGSVKIAVFVNIGGSYANMGTSSLVLNVKPGLNTRWTMPPESERGMLFEMASRGIPCIHLLYIRGLVQEFGLLWDPVPLPDADENSDLHPDTPNHVLFFMMTALYFGLVAVSLFYYRSR
jgi:poly-gamma-glutamate system protein